jgi:hypothetical protein
MTDLFEAALEVVKAVRSEVASSEGHMACTAYPCGLCTALAAFDAVPTMPVFHAAADAVYDPDVCQSTGGTHAAWTDGTCVRCGLLLTDPCCDLHTATCGDVDHCCDNCPTITEGAPA